MIGGYNFYAELRIFSLRLCFWVNVNGKYEKLNQFWNWNVPQLTSRKVMGKCRNTEKQRILKALSCDILGIMASNLEDYFSISLNV